MQHRSKCIGMVLHSGHPENQERLSSCKISNEDGPLLKLSKKDGGDTSPRVSLMLKS